MRITDSNFNHYADDHPERCQRVAVFFARDITDEVVMLDAEHGDYDVLGFRDDWSEFFEETVRPKIDDRDQPNDEEAPVFLSEAAAAVAADVNSFGGAGSGIPHLGIFVGVCCETPPGPAGVIKPTSLFFDGEVRGLTPAEYTMLRDPVMFWAAVMGADASNNWEVRP
jgi:hypothetical protein